MKTRKTKEGAIEQIMREPRAKYPNVTFAHLKDILSYVRSADMKKLGIQRGDREKDDPEKDLHEWGYVNDDDRLTPEGLSVLKRIFLSLKTGPGIHTAECPACKKTYTVSGPAWCPCTPSNPFRLTPTKVVALLSKTFGKPTKPPKKTCDLPADLCGRTDAHIHCPECGSTDHAAADCDNEG